MKDTTFLPTRPATPDDVLAVFRDGYRFQLEYDPEAEPGYEIEYGMTVGNWTIACDLIRPGKLGPVLGEEFGVEATRKEWLQVLEPVKKRTLRDVCVFISVRGGRVPAVENFQIFGSSCDTAGAFLSIRSMLDKHGADVSGLRPSSSVTDFVRKGGRLGALLNAMHLLAPGILHDPVQHKKSRILDKFGALILLSGFLAGLVGVLVWAGSSISGYIGGPAVAESITDGAKGWFAGTGAATFFAAFLVWWLSAKIWPTEHSFPPVETFADLARAVAAYVPPSSSE